MWAGGALLGWSGGGVGWVALSSGCLGWFGVVAFWFDAGDDLLCEVVVLGQADSDEGVDHFFLAQGTFAVAVPGEEQVFGDVDLLLLKGFPSQLLVVDADMLLFLAYHPIVPLDEAFLYLALCQQLALLHPSFHVGLPQILHWHHLFNFITESHLGMYHILQIIIVKYFRGLSRFTFRQLELFQHLLRSLNSLLLLNPEVISLSWAHQIRLVS